MKGDEDMDKCEQENQEYFFIALLGILQGQGNRVAGAS